VLYKASPADVKLLMIDPKVVEFEVYNGLPHLLVPVVSDAKKASGALGWAVAEMEKRYKLFGECKVRDLASYNQFAENNEGYEHMPQILIVVDELADLMMVAPAEVEDSICRLAQKARAAGMHLVVATQRPSADVITGLIKANIPSRISLKVANAMESRIILDTPGAEKLLGKGDMLFYPVGSPKPLRVQGCWVSDVEIKEVVNYIIGDQVCEYSQEISEEIEKHVVESKGKKSISAEGDDDTEGDEMIPQAMEVVVEAGLASTSLLQRKLKLGYARAARIVDQLEERGIVGPFEGAKPRKVLISKQQYEEMRMNQSE
jgi:S-DNA-T family DNA segregation ATPase FtsK/SpoIIIE